MLAISSVVGRAAASQSGDMQAGDMNVLSKTKIALSAAVVLSATFPTWAATKHHHRVTYARPFPDHNSGDCSPVHPPFCRHICTGSGPCAPPERCLKVPQERLCY